MARYLSFLLVLFLSVGAYAQTTTVKGKVVFSDDPQTVIGAVVVVNIEDSTRHNVKGRVAATDASGNFTVWTSDKEIELTINYTGYKEEKYKVKMGKGGTIDVGEIKIKPDSKMIETVTVVGQASMSMIKDDTLQFNAAAFQTQPDATAADLLKKMPGVTTDDDGNIEAQGETISKVYVNGKEYFESDPSLALKSLPVDAIESVQIYDDQSDDAKFSGFDDGERVKAVNIVVKEGFINSLSGRVSAGYGTDGRYSTGLQVNKYGDVHNFAIIGQANNANIRDFTPMDITSGGGRGGGRGQWSSNTDLSSYNTSSFGGITETYMLGGNYSGDFEKVDVTATYFYMGSNADNWRNTQQNYLTTIREYLSSSNSLGYSNAHNLSSKVEWNPTDRDRFNITLTASYSNNHGGSGSATETFVDSLLSNYNNSDYSTELERMSGSFGLWWTHRFGKAGRTLSVGGNASGNLDSGNRYQFSEYGSDSGLSDLIIDTIDMIGLVDASGYNDKGSVTYAEPISKKSLAKVNYSLTYDRSFSDNRGFDYDNAVQTYTLEDTTTTNYINRNYTTQIGGLGYSYINGKKLTVNATLNYQYAQLNNTQISPLNTLITEDGSDKTYREYSFEAVLPSVTVNYSPASGHNLRADYNAYSSFPSVGQLQDIIDNTDPLQVSIGNPNLEQSYSHSLRMRYNFANPQKNINFNLFANGTLTSNYIATNRKFLTADTVVSGVTVVDGAEFSVPVNLQGYASAMMHSTFSFGIKPLKSNMSVSVWYRYSHTPSISDDVEYISVSNRVGGNLSLTSNISQYVDFTVAYKPGVNTTKGGTGTIDNYYSHDVSTYLNLIFWKHFFINSEFTWKNSFGTQSTYTQHYALLNAAIGAKFFQNNCTELRFGVNDALNQNQSIWQSSYDTYTQITESQALQRYYMVTLSYKFDTRRNKNNSDTNYERTYGGGGRPPMM